MTFKSGKRNDQGPSVVERRTRDISNIDREILRLLSRRSDLLSREGSWRKNRGKTRVDPALDKAVWSNWEKAARDLKLDPSMLRQLYNAVNLFGHEPTRHAARETAYVLAPNAEPVALDVYGPASHLHGRMWTTLTAACGQDMTLYPVILNDSMIELVKALNQAGASMSWSDGKVEGLATKAENPLDFEDKLVFAGNDPFNLYLLIAVALPGAGRVKFSGGAGLKMFDLSNLNSVLPRLGARIVPLNPRGEGVPARLEFGGDMNPLIKLPEAIPAEFVAALALAAWSYPKGLRIEFQDRPDVVAALARSVEVLRSAGIKATLDNGSCFVPGGKPNIPAQPVLPMDPALAAYLLAMPMFADGRSEVRGQFSSEDELASYVREQFISLGLEISDEKGAVVSTSLRLPQEDITLGRNTEFFPLALAFGLRARRTIRVLIPDDDQMVRLGLEMLERLEADFTLEEDAVIIQRSTLRWRESWTSPSPHFSLALALIAYLRPGIGLSNPGELTAVWPQFWNIYNSLPTGRMRPKPIREPKKDDNGKKGRRIKV